MKCSFEKASKLLENERDSFKKLDSFVNDWAKASNKKMSLKVDKKYQARYDKLENKNNKDYEKYYKYIIKNFSRKECDQLIIKGNSFTSKTFLNKLFKGHKKED